MAGVVAGDILDQDDASIDVQALSKGNVPTLMSRAFQWGIQDAYMVRRGNGARHTLQPDFVPFQAFDTLIEKLSCTGFISNSVNINFLKVDGDILIFKEGFNCSCCFLSDTIARNQSDLVPA